MAQVSVLQLCYVVLLLAGAVRSCVKHCCAFQNAVAGHTAMPYLGTYVLPEISKVSTGPSSNICAVPCDRQQKRKTDG